MKVILTDLDENIILKFDSTNINYEVKSTKTIESIKDNIEYPVSSDILNKLDEELTVLYYSQEEDEFIIKYISEGYLHLEFIDTIELIDKKFSECFKFIDNLDIIKYFKEVQETKETKEFLEFHYIEDILVDIFHHKLIFDSGFLYHLEYQESDLKILSYLEKKSFIKSKEIGLKYRDNKIVEVSEGFLNHFKIDSDEILGEFNLNSLSYFNKSQKEVNDSITNLLNREKFFDVIEFEYHSKKLKLNHILRAYISPSVYNSNPALKILLEDISEKRIEENEEKKLKEQINNIQKTNDFSIFIKNNDNYIWDDKIYEILEINKNNKNVGCISKYIPNEDAKKFLKNIEDLNYEYNHFNMNCELNVSRNNKKYINIKVELFFNENTDKQCIGFITDKTEQIITENILKENINNLERNTTELINIENELKRNKSSIEKLLTESYKLISNILSMFLKEINLKYATDNLNEEIIKLNIRYALNRKINIMHIFYKNIINDFDLLNVNTKKYIKDILKYLSEDDVNCFIYESFIEDFYLDIGSSLILGFIIFEIITLYSYNSTDSTYTNIKISLKNINENVLLEIINKSDLRDNPKIIDSSNYELIECMCNFLEGEWNENFEENSFNLTFKQNNERINTSEETCWNFK